MDENEMDDMLEQIYNRHHQVVEVKNVFNEDRFYIEMPVQYMISDKKDGCKNSC